MAAVCFNTRQDIVDERGIKTNANGAANNGNRMPHLRVAAAASATAAAHAALQKTRKCSTARHPEAIRHDGLEALSRCGGGKNKTSGRF
jgi:hypothetical protein